MTVAIPGGEDIMVVPPLLHKTPGGNSAYHNFNNDFAHIQNPDERRRLALAEIDKAPFGWYHVRVCVVSGIGFFTDSYDIFAVGLLTTMLGIVYGDGGQMPIGSDTAIKVATSGGTVVGQLLFGIMADVLGRKKMYGLELAIIIFATLAQALSSSSASMDIVGVVIFWRVVMGIGIGGDYPLSSIITSEFATTKWRGAMMAAVFTMQGFGQLCAALVMLVGVLGFRQSLVTAATVRECTGVCRLAVDKMWRVLVGFGAFPACIALYYRLTIPETPRYTFDVARDAERASADAEAYISGQAEGQVDRVRHAQALQYADRMSAPAASSRDFVRYYAHPRNALVLFGTAGSWFLLDVAFYGLSLNTPVVLAAIGYSGGPTVYHLLHNTALGNLIVVLAGALPGYGVTVATIDTIGRKPIQIGGFAILTGIFVAMGFAYRGLTQDQGHALLALYVVAQFVRLPPAARRTLTRARGLELPCGPYPVLTPQFFNFGPNATTFIVPGECFPTRYRSTSHGISAASGKLGSIIAQAAIAPLRTRGATPTDPSPWLDHVLEIYALFMFLGIFTSLCIPETKRKTLEQLSDEDARAVRGAEIRLESRQAKSVADDAVSL